MRAVRRILLAEGHGPTREFVVQSLAAAGFDVLVAEDPQQAEHRVVGALRTRGRGNAQRHGGDEENC